MAPDLRASPLAHDYESLIRIVQGGALVSRGMPKYNELRDDEIRDLLDEHPHTVALRAREPRRLAAAIIGWPSVLSLAFGAAGGAGSVIRSGSRLPGRVGQASALSGGD